MKKLLFTLALSYFGKLSITLCSMLYVPSSAYAQTIPPPYINYQAVLYDVNSANPNAVLANQSFPTYVNIQDELGNLLYKEEHFASTDANGLITVKMGDGVYMAGPITNFNLINWGVGKYYLIVDFDINGTISSTAPEQLVTVPYSFYSGKAGNGMAAVADNGNGTLTFTYANGSTYTTPTLAGIQGPAGPVGPSGASGPAGATGQSAYDLWLAQGNVGSSNDFLNSLGSTSIDSITNIPLTISNLSFSNFNSNSSFPIAQTNNVVSTLPIKGFYLSINFDQNLYNYFQSGNINLALTMTFQDGSNGALKSFFSENDIVFTEMIQTLNCGYRGTNTGFNKNQYFGNSLTTNFALTTGYLYNSSMCGVLSNAKKHSRVMFKEPTTNVTINCSGTITSSIYSPNTSYPISFLVTALPIY